MSYMAQRCGHRGGVLRVDLEHFGYSYHGFLRNCPCSGERFGVMMNGEVDYSMEFS